MSLEGKVAWRRSGYHSGRWTAAKLAVSFRLERNVASEDLRPRYQRPVAQRYIFPESGEVIAVRGAEEVASWDGIALCDVRVKPGEVLDGISSHRGRAGVVIATGSDREAAVSLAEAAVKHIQVVTRQGD